MWVWESQAPGGTSKFTGVAGCEALAKPVRMCIVAPAAIAPIRSSRRVSIGFLPDGISPNPDYAVSSQFPRGPDRGPGDDLTRVRSASTALRAFPDTEKGPDY